MPRRKKSTEPARQFFDDTVDRNWANHIRRPATALERLHKHREAAREISTDFAAASLLIDWTRRRAALSSFRTFIETYCMDEGGIFEYAPFAETDRILSVMCAAATSATPYHLRLTRGAGKTTLMIALAAFLLCSRLKRFIVLVGAKADLAGQMVEDLSALFLSSPALQQDFPEFSLPLTLLDGSMQRAASQRFLGKPTLCRVNRKALRFPVLSTGCPLIPHSSGGAIVLAVGFDGRTRGLRVGKRRPDFILLDDLQTDDLADNPERVEDARRKIYKTFMRLGSSIDKPSVLMTSTPIAPDDLSESIANDPNWKTETFPLMTAMPSESAMALWKQYHSIKVADTINSNFAAHSELNFYADHRAEMDDGAIPFWHDCFDRDGTEISAIQHAMNRYLEDPESFASEYQMHPRRANLAIELPRSRVARAILPKSPRLTIPTGFVYVTAATDINPSYALTTTIVAFKPDRTAFISDHFITPIHIDGKLDDTNFNRAVYDHLARLGATLAQLPVHIDAWGIDGSGRQFSPVTSFARLAAKLDTVKIPAMAMLGRSQTKFNPTVKSRLKDAINSTVLCGDDVEHAALAQHKHHLGNRWIIWDADRYKESFQRAMLTEIGAPGGCTLFSDPGEDPQKLSVLPSNTGDHTDFAIQVTNEKLVGKRPHGDGREDYVWNSTDPHDYLDCMAMCYALAGHNGISGNIAHTVTHRRRPRYVYKH